MTYLHILAGGLALTSGFLALYSPKGGDLHRLAGWLFTAAMLVMAGLGAVMALGGAAPDRGTAMIGLLCCYLVTSGYLAVARKVADARPALIALAVAAWGIGITGMILAGMAAASANGRIDHLPMAPVLVFASLGLLGALGDTRMLLRGGIEGRARIFRHLWRMGLALWIATSSFFFGQAKFLPDVVRENGWHFVPVLAVLLTLLFWMLRVRWWRRAQVPARKDSTSITKRTLTSLPWPRAGCRDR